MAEEWRYLELGDFLLIAEAVTGIPAEILAGSERVVSQADSALHVPSAGFGDVEAYPNFAEKAAILCARIIQDHPLPDGNKRTAFICLVEFVERNARRFELLPEDTAPSVADVLVDLTAHSISERDFVQWVAARIRE
jgi:death-on-curing protein